MIMAHPNESFPKSPLSLLTLHNLAPTCLPASATVPPFSNYNRIHIITKTFHPLFCCCGFLSLEMLTNPSTLFIKLPFLTQKQPCSQQISLPPPGSQFCLSLCSYHTLLIIHLLESKIQSVPKECIYTHTVNNYKVSIY